MLVDWTSHMLGNRQLEVTKGNTTVRGDVSSGCPQGGVMSPLLWCLVVDNLLTNLSEEGCQVVGYADDILIIRCGPFLYTLMELTQGDLRIVEACCRSTGLGVNPDKTEVMVFTRKYKWDRTCRLTLNGKALKLSKEVKYLGVTIDSKLTWGIHLEVKCQKFTAALWQLRRALGRNWGLKPVAMKWLFDAILKPRRTYAAVVWWNRTHLKTAEGQLERL